MSVDKTTPARTTRAEWATMLTLGLGVSVVIMDATVVNVALPVVIENLGLDASEAQWLNASYALVFAATLLAFGKLGDLWGRRRVFTTGLALFMSASVMAGLAQSPEWLITARFVQGLGGAMIVPATLSTLNATFTGAARSKAFAVWGASIGGMAAVGPFVGGWLTTQVDWRWAFWLNIPLGLLVLTGIARYVPETRDVCAIPGLDLVGTLLSTLGLGALVFGFIEGSYFGWWRQDSGVLSPVPFALVGGLVALTGMVAWVRHRRRTGRSALVDLGLFRLPTFRYGMIAATVVSFGEFGLLFTLPLLLQGTLGYTALGTGTLILVLAVGTFLVSAAVPHLTTRFGSRALVRAGLAAEVVAVAGLGLSLTLDIAGWLLAGWLFLYGLGVGLATAQLTNVLLADVRVDESGQASGLQSSGRQVGAALGVALLGSLLITTLGSATAANLSGIGMAGSAGDGIVAAVRGSAGIAIAGLQDNPAMAAVAQAASEAMVHASRLTLVVAAGVLLLGLLATLALPRQRSAVTADADSVSR